MQLVKGGRVPSPGRVFLKVAVAISEIGESCEGEQQDFLLLSYSLQTSGLTRRCWKRPSHKVLVMAMFFNK